MRLKYKSDKGVAGLTILLSVIVMLFVIGLFVMIFAMMGGELKDATYTPSTRSTSNETHLANTTAQVFSLTNNEDAYRDAVCTLTSVINASNNVVIKSGNYSQSNCDLNVSSASATVDDVNWNVTYSTSYNADNTATNVMNDTTAGLVGVTSWFPIFIVISAMVVLILLTVIIITAIRGSGLMTEGSA